MKYGVYQMKEQHVTTYWGFELAANPETEGFELIETAKTLEEATARVSELYKYGR